MGRAHILPSTLGHGVLSVAFAIGLVMPLRIRDRRRQLVRVHTKSGPSFEGVYVCRRRGHYVLELAKLLEAHAPSVQLDGWVEIPEKSVVFLQLLAEEAD